MELRRGTEQRALFLTPRSLLVMADEARYAWHHYIPHRRSDTVDGQSVPRAASRVSFTFRKVINFCSSTSCELQLAGMCIVHISCTVHISCAQQRLYRKSDPRWEADTGMP